MDMMTERTRLGLARPGLLNESAYIDGKWVAAAAGLEVRNPATGRQLGTVPLLGAAETLEAVEAAHRALADWRARSADERASVLRRWSQLILRHDEDLAR